MTSSQLGTVALGAVGIWLAVTGAATALWAAIPITPNEDYAVEDIGKLGFLASGLFQVVAGGYLHLRRAAVAGRWFGADETLDRVELIHVQVVATGLLGLFFVANGLAQTAANLGSEDPYGGVRTVSGLLYAVSGAALVLGRRWIAGSCLGIREETE